MDPLTQLLSEFGTHRLHLAVVGLGAVGGVFGSALIDGIAGDDRAHVSFLVTERHVAPLRRNGLCFFSNQGMRIIHPHSIASSPLEVMMPVHIVIWAVKAGQFETVLRFWHPVLAGNGWAISLLNGVDNGAKMSRNLPGLRIIDGCVYVGAHLKAPGQVRWEGGPRRMLIGDIGPQKTKLDSLCDLFRRGGVEAEAVPQIFQAIWEKFSFVSPVAVATSLYSCSLKELLKQPERLSLFKALTEEILLLARAENVLLNEATPEEAVAKLGQFENETTSSLYRDLQQGRRGEFDILVEDVIEKSHEHGLDLPVYRRCRDRLFRRYFSG